MRTGISVFCNLQFAIRNGIPLNLQQAIREATEKLTRAGVPNARLDAEVLLSHVLGKDRAWLFVHDRDELSGEYRARFEQAVEQRAVRKPLQYILGTQEFWGLEFAVTPDVLIPRPETELVVESALRFLKRKTHPVMIDLCTGSGCIAVSVAKEIPDGRVTATDKSGPALNMARRNAGAHQVSDRIEFLEGDLFQPLGRRRFTGSVDVITANPPYVPSGELPSLQPEVRDYEPEMALISGPDGTEIHTRILAEAPQFLRTGGVLIMEMGIGQAQHLAEIAGSIGSYSRPEILKDLAGIERVIVVSKK